MKTVIEDESTGTTQMECTSLPTVVRSSLGLGAEDEIDELVQQIAGLSTAVQELTQQVTNEAIEREVADVAATQRIEQAETYIQQQVQQINQKFLLLKNEFTVLKNTYPKVVMAGVINGNGSVSASGIDFTDTRYVISVTPEAGHEGWDITRGTESFSVNVWNRSGTNRVGYDGKIGYVVTQVSAIA